MVLTKTKTTKLKCLLLDADVVIEAYEIEVWEELISRIKVAVPSVVSHDEALFYSEKAAAIPPAIDLPHLAKQGRIYELTASSDDLEAVRAVFDLAFIEGLHAGETEALALLLSGKAEDCLFCTGDRLAIQALALLGLADRGISLEEVLTRIGLQRALRFQYGEDFFKRNIRIGQQRRITGDGLARE